MVKWLYDNLEIIHGDISWGNIMYRRENGKVYGVLNDFDLARFVGKPASSNQRTGTRPFMSMAALKGQRIGFRDELESVYYCLITFVSRRDSTGPVTQTPWGWKNHIVSRTDVDELPYEDWFVLDRKDKYIANSKVNHFIGTNVQKPSTEVAPCFLPVFGEWVDAIWISYYRQYVNQGMASRGLDKEDKRYEVTLGVFLGVAFADGPTSCRKRNYYKDVNFD